tara:strand:+ start:64 stop:1113 length:1050 start_codon:yes stop_codon:yes gene_type:complete
MTYFDSKRLTPLPNNGEGYNDGSDTLAEEGLTILFQHVPSGQVVKFKAFITAYNESFSSDWSSESVFGRADPIFMFKQTTRKVNLAFKIPSSTTGEGYENLGRLQTLAKFLYPVYDKVSNAMTISQSPLLRLRVLNLLQNRNASGTGLASADFSKFFGPSSVGNGTDKKGGFSESREYTQSDGILGVLHSLNINHNLENIETAAYEGGPQGSRVVIPRMIDVAIDFTCLHEHPVGWEDRGKRKVFSTPSFPYGVQDFAANGGEVVGADEGAAALSDIIEAGRTVLTEAATSISESYDETLAFFGFDQMSEDTPDDEWLDENAEECATEASTSSQADIDQQAAAIESATS